MRVLDAGVIKREEGVREQKVEGQRRKKEVFTQVCDQEAEKKGNGGEKALGGAEK